MQILQKLQRQKYLHLHLHPHWRQSENDHILPRTRKNFGKPANTHSDFYGHYLDLD